MKLCVVLIELSKIFYESGDNLYGYLSNIRKQTMQHR